MTFDHDDEDAIARDIEVVSGLREMDAEDYAELEAAMMAETVGEWCEDCGRARTVVCVACGDEDATSGC